MGTAEELVSRLGSEATFGYGLRAIPDPLDDDIRQFVSVLTSADEAYRAALIGLMGEHHGFVLKAFADRMTTLAVRAGDRRHLNEAVVALAIAARLIDPRDCFVVLAPLYDAAQRIGADPGSTFVAPPFAEELFSPLLEAFPHRAEEDRSLAAMLCVESTDADGFRYKRVQ